MGRISLLKIARPPRRRLTQQAAPRCVTLALPATAPKVDRHKSRITRIRGSALINAWQRDIIERLDGLARTAFRAESPSTALILATRDFTHWLEDERFMSQLIRAFLPGSSGNALPPAAVDVVAGVADGLSPDSRLGEPRRGFSICFDSKETMFPDSEKPAPSESSLDAGREAAISFLVRQPGEDDGSIEVTLPLANTVFQNGRPSTLFTSRWQPDSSRGFKRATPRHVQHVTMQLTSPGGRLDPFIPLLPLTGPRRVLSGLGNIVRELDIRGVTSPASKELESLIPKVLESRAKSTNMASPGPPGPPGPMAIWAWVIPPHVTESGKLPRFDIFPSQLGRSERELALAATETFSRLVQSGCRLHKIRKCNEHNSGRRR